MYTYIGEDWVYKNLVPPMNVELKHGQQYDIHIEFDAQVVYINGVPIQTKPKETRVVLPPEYQAWIPYNPARFVKDWQPSG
jgi:hypothetical protein